MNPVSINVLLLTKHSDTLPIRQQYGTAASWRRSNVSCAWMGLRSPAQKHNDLSEWRKGWTDQVWTPSKDNMMSIIIILKYTVLFPSWCYINDSRSFPSSCTVCLHRQPLLFCFPARVCVSARSLYWFCVCADHLGCYSLDQFRKVLKRELVSKRIVNFWRRAKNRNLPSLELLCVSGFLYVCRMHARMCVCLCISFTRTHIHTHTHTHREIGYGRSGEIKEMDKMAETRWIGSVSVPHKRTGGDVGNEGEGEGRHEQGY